MFWVGGPDRERYAAPTVRSGRPQAGSYKGPHCATKTPRATCRSGFNRDGKPQQSPMLYAPPAIAQRPEPSRLKSLLQKHDPMTRRIAGMTANNLLI